MSYDSPLPTSSPTSNHAANLFMHVLAGNSGAPPTPTGLQAASQRTEQAQVGRLIHCGQTIERLKDARWYAHMPVVTTTQLDTTTATAILIRLYEHGSTGVFTARNRQGQQRIVALVGGTPVAIASLNPEDRLGTYMVESGRINAAVAQQAMTLMQDEDKPLGWALLKLGAVSSGELLRTLQTHAEQNLTAMLSWTDGEVQFREVAQTVDLRRVIDTPFLALIRQTFAHVYRQDGATLRSFTAPFFQRQEPLQWREVSARLEPLVEGVNPVLMECARKNGTPADLTQAMQPHDAMQFNRTLADIYICTQLGFLGFVVGAAPIRLANIPTMLLQGDSRPSGNAADPLATYRQHKDAIAAAKRALHSFNPQDAASRLDHLMQKSPDVPPLEAEAYLSIALALVGDTERAMSIALRVLKRQPQDALAHAAACRAFEAAGNRAQANYHYKNALALSEKNPEWYAEVTGALKMTASPQGRQQGKPAVGSGRALPLWLMVVMTYLVLFALANVLRLGGDREYFYLWDEPFFYVRRLTLLVLGITGWCVWRGASPLELVRTQPWKLPWVWVGRIALYGAIVGLASPMQRITGDFGPVTALCLLHALCEEVFFRGFLTSVLLDQTGEIKLAVLVSAVLYAAYHLTYYSFWMESGWQVRMFYMGLIAAFAGVPYALLFQRTRTLTAPLVCHVCVTTCMMWFSILRRH